MQFDWWTLILQIVNFLILVWLLRHFLYKPVQAVIAKRREMAEAVLADADAKRAEVEAEKKRLDEELARLEAERQDILDKTRKDAEARRRAIIDVAERRAAAMLEEARAKSEEQRKADMQSLKQNLADAAVAIARPILEQTADESLDAVFRRRLLGKLDALARDGDGSARPDWTASTVHVTTAAPLPDTEKAAWLEALVARGFKRETPKFSVDPKLVAGAELRLPHGRLSFTWADELEQAENLLTAQKAKP